MVEKAQEIANNMDEKDKKAIEEQANKLKEEAQKKVGEVVKKVDEVVNSPAANIVGSVVGSVAGPDARDKFKTGQKIVRDIASNPNIVGEQQRRPDQQDHLQLQYFQQPWPQLMQVQQSLPYA